MGHGLLQATTNCPITEKQQCYVEATAFKHSLRALFTFQIVKVLDNSTIVLQLLSYRSASSIYSRRKKYTTMRRAEMRLASIFYPHFSGYDEFTVGVRQLHQNVPLTILSPGDFKANVTIKRETAKQNISMNSKLTCVFNIQKTKNDWNN